MEGFSPNQQPDWRPQPSELETPEPQDHDRLTPVERLEAARPHLDQLVTSMAPDIRAGRWDAILGDDVSARIPTLILRGVIARSYADQGRPAPKTNFVAMGQEFSYMNPDRLSEKEAARIKGVKDYLASGEKPQRVLFVTDNIAMGGSINEVLEALDELGIPCDVASAQEPKEVVRSVVAQNTSHAAYSREEAEAMADRRAAELPFGDEQDRRYFIDFWTRTVGHELHDPEAKYYGVETSQGSQPFHMSEYSRPRGRAAVGVEKYGEAPTTEGRRHHALRELNNGELRPDARVPANPDEAELRHAAADMAEDLYQKLIADNQKEA